MTIQYRHQPLTRPVKRVVRVLLLDGYEPYADRRPPQSVDDGGGGAEFRGTTRSTCSAVHAFNPVMSPAERAAYHSDQPVISDDVRDSAERLAGSRRPCSSAIRPLRSTCRRR